jgi:isoleucyl-tRNA synthetase
VDLSSFYLDVLKDRMYTFAPSSLARRSAQTVLWQITEALVRLVAPILTFTADEVWEQSPPVAGREISVHLARFPRAEEIFSEDPAKLIEEWKQLLLIRDEVFKSLEDARQRKEIGKGLEADVMIAAGPQLHDRLKEYGAYLKELFNVSSAKIEVFDAEPVPTAHFHVYEPVGLGFKIVVSAASGTKCARCWNFMPDTADYGIWHDVCGRCRNALTEMGIAPPEPEVAH